VNINYVTKTKLSKGFIMDYTKTLQAINQGLNPTRVHDALVDDAKAEIHKVFNDLGCTTIILTEIFECETNSHFIYAISKGYKENLNWWYSEDNDEAPVFYNADEDMENHDGGSIDGHDILGIDIIRVVSAYIQPKDFTTE